MADPQYTELLRHVAHLSNNSMEEIVGRHSLLMIELLKLGQNGGTQQQVEALMRRVGAIQQRWITRLVPEQNADEASLRQKHFSVVVKQMLDKFFASILQAIQTAQRNGRIMDPQHERVLDFGTGFYVGLSPRLASNAMETEKKLSNYIYWILRLAVVEDTKSRLFMDRSFACLVSATSFGFWVDNNI